MSQYRNSTEEEIHYITRTISQRRKESVIGFEIY